MNIGGYPRNYVRVPDDRPALVDAEGVAAAVRAHHALFTTAPFVSLRVNGGDIGDVAPARDHHARAEITVQAAPWVSVYRVVLYVNGQPVKRWELPGAATAALRFHDTWSFDVAADSYVVARVEGDRSLSPVVGDRNAFAAYPFALTNPVFLDTD